jgi:pimeloyl-ACP methyl ester carboxylesterase
MTIQPFRIGIPDAALSDLKQRLAQTRWPDAIPGSGFTYGLDLNYMHQLRDYWMAGFDWRACEAAWNRLPNFRFESERFPADGMAIHFIHVRGRARERGPAPLPIVLTHGWPGSFLEMLKIIPLLTDPQANGGDAADAFDVVVPSMPGYGFSSRPRRRGVDCFVMADLWAELMQQLCYAKFIAQGGDFGSDVSTVLAWKHPQQVLGLHLNSIPPSYRPDPDGAPQTAEERQFHEDEARWNEEKGGYCAVQVTQPQTLAFAMNDSPMGLAAWIIDRFRDWSDCGGEVERRFTRDELLANVSLYWLTETAGSSMRLYYESRQTLLHLGKGERISVPTAVAKFDKEAPFPPRAWVERGYNLQRWTKYPSGGHFAAMEEPQKLAQDIREFARQFRR